MDEWELDVELPAIPPTHLDEGYTSLYALDVGGTAGNDLVMRLHPNGLCVIALAPSHAALRQPSAAGGGGGSSSQAAQGGGSSATAATNASGAGGPQRDAEAAQQPAAAPAAGQQPAAQQQQQQPAAVAVDNSQQAGGEGARLVLGQKLLQAEMRKGRGPGLQLESVLGRWVGGKQELTASSPFT